MAKVTITIEDTIDDTGEETLNMQLHFEPQVQRDNDLTPAQACAMSTVEHVRACVDGDIKDVKAGR